MKKLIAALLISTPLVSIADVVVLDDHIVDGSQCVGFDCVNGESFGFDTLRLKENNIRINVEDTSSSASFPGNDWRLVFNDSANGGSNYFAVEDSTAGKTAFKVEAAAPSNTLVVESTGDVGIGTANPVVKLHTVDGDSPTLRLEQNGSSGFTPQTWDMAANETNFFIRDATNGSKLPFRIQPGTPSSALTLKADGNVGMGTWSPSETLHIKKQGDAGIRLENSTATVGSTWRIYNQADSGKLKFTDDPSGVRTPLKLEKDGVTNLVKIGGSISTNGAETNSKVEINGSLKATYLVADDGKIYKLSDIVTALSNLNEILPTYE
ncbi:hypothetical protein A9R00_02050 [Oleispira antarctica]|uniref:Uncharacterized protein n=1 Tax=Oleispira antarctica TaxID=188908 RepID=A0A1Y5HZJ3_OLEAN|nr:hypothetical protein A9R00_02050 [Oleispira antarctica]